ncbi:class I adenylate-forming enzyme family protein [Amycolatopsis thermophila]|uniref:Acyl-CoA synthetase (AMP-forming)/AMP-acid ligase II n=1 Tax=Amycolatopsis thermophila TaxID=206084 RepID=A0ABU0F2A5_9PSEU|nr:AMP-binding protein [Amycolatopsis thermophila]MDQ0381157.1 acyl-CoA synthetase (AMP-forming)/AMP-acid ligase II [Amycolatopsis thermophila]
MIVTLQATLASAFTDVHAKFATRPAVLGPDGPVLTYGELGARARRLAHGLTGLGAGTGDRIIVVSANRTESFVVDHALAVGGFVRVALSIRLHPREIAAIARDCEARVAIVDAEREPGVAAAFAEAGRDTAVVALDEPAGPVAARYPDLLAGPELDPARPDPDDLAWLPYTSGTTGEPKGVMLSHRNLLAYSRNLMVELPPIETSDVVLHVAPLTHLSGYVSLPFQLRGAQHLPMASFAPEPALRAVAEHGVTVLPIVPTMLTMMLPALETGSHTTDSLHTVLYAGSAIAPDRLARLVRCLGPVFVQGYGLTETPLPLTALSKQDHRVDPAGPLPARLGSAGRVSPFVQVRVRTPDGRDASEGEEGEIQVRGDITMLGYWNRPAATAEVLLPGGWVATGDVGRFHDGYLHIVDRKKDMIVSGGFNVFPGEIENAISALEGVAEVAVIGVPDERWGETIKAVISVREGHRVTAEDVDRICRERIASYKRPRSVEFVEALPKTGTGKIQRSELRRRHWAGADRRVGG